jgi:hypothetical protein
MVGGARTAGTTMCDWQTERRVMESTSLMARAGYGGRYPYCIGDAMGAGRLAARGGRVGVGAEMIMRRISCSHLGFVSRSALDIRGVSPTTRSRLWIASQLAFVLLFPRS